VNTWRTRSLLPVQLLHHCYTDWATRPTHICVCVCIYIYIYIYIYIIILQTLLHISVFLHRLLWSLILLLLKSSNIKITHFRPPHQTHQHTSHTRHTSTPAHQTHRNRTCEFHMQPLSHFTNSTHFIIQRPTSIISVLHNFSKRNITAPWRWCRGTETCRSDRNII